MSSHPPTVYIFADEAGNLDFSNKGSEYFTVGAVTMRSIEIGSQLLALRHELAVAGTDIEWFHAAEEQQAVRDRVFPLIQEAPLDIDAIILHKRKTYPRISKDEAYFYQLAWHMLFKSMAPVRCRQEDHLLVVAGSLGTGERKARFKRALR